MKTKKINIFISAMLLTVIISIICGFPFSREFPIIIFIANVLLLDIIMNHWNKGWIAYFVLSIVYIFVFCIRNEIDCSVKIFITLFLVSVYIGYVLHVLYRFCIKFIKK